MTMFLAIFANAKSSIGAKLVEEYEKLLSEGHGLSCPWRNKGCDGMSTGNAEEKTTY